LPSSALAALAGAVVAVTVAALAGNLGWIALLLGALSGAAAWRAVRTKQREAAAEADMDPNPTPASNDASLPSSEALGARIVAGAMDAILFVDRTGAIRLWNAGAEAMFGWTAAEAVGRNLDLIIPERLRARHWENWDRVMDTGQTRYARDVLAVPAVAKDGRTISIEFTITLVRDADGRILGPAAIIRDVSERFRREKELRARVKELEAAAAAKPA
jgi:PAS domain S-box-containing protein